MSVLDPTIAERSRRYRRRRRATLRSQPAATVRSPRGATVRSPLSARQEAAIDALLDVIGEHGEGPGPDGEPVAPLAAWRAKVRAMARGQTARQVRRLTQGLIDLGCVLERDGMVAVGDFGVDIEVARGR